MLYSYNYKFSSASLKGMWIFSSLLPVYSPGYIFLKDMGTMSLKCKHWKRELSYLLILWVGRSLISVSTWLQLQRTTTYHEDRWSVTFLLGEANWQTQVTYASCYPALALYLFSGIKFFFSSIEIHIVLNKVFLNYLTLTLPVLLEKLGYPLPPGC